MEQKKDNSEGAFGELKKVTGKAKPMIKCANVECTKSFIKRGPKKFCSPKCQWTVYNRNNPIMRKLK